jgi:hypothetical protein
MVAMASRETKMTMTGTAWQALLSKVKTSVQAFEALIQPIVIYDQLFLIGKVQHPAGRIPSVLMLWLHATGGAPVLFKQRRNSTAALSQYFGAQNSIINHVSS